MLSLKAIPIFVGIRGSVTHFQSLGNTTRFQNELTETLLISVENRKIFPPRVFCAPAERVHLGIGCTDKMPLDKQKSHRRQTKASLNAPIRGGGIII